MGKNIYLFIKACSALRKKTIFLRKYHFYFMEMLDFLKHMLDFKNICSILRNVCSILKIYARLSGTNARLQKYLPGFFGICSIARRYARFFQDMLGRQNPTHTAERFTQIKEHLQVEFNEIVSIGDNWINEILPATKMGCSTILIDPHQIGKWIYGIWKKDECLVNLISMAS